MRCWRASGEGYSSGSARTRGGLGRRTAVARFWTTDAFPRPFFPDEGLVDDRRLAPDRGRAWRQSRRGGRRRSPRAAPRRRPGRKTRVDGARPRPRRRRTASCPAPSGAGRARAAPVVAASLRPDIGRKRFRVPRQADRAARSILERLAAASRPSAVSIVAMIAVAPSSIAFSASRRASLTESCCDAGRPARPRKDHRERRGGHDGVEVAVGLAGRRAGSRRTIRAGPSGRCAASARTRAAWTRAASRRSGRDVEIDTTACAALASASASFAAIVARRDEQRAHALRRTRSPARAGA